MAKIPEIIFSESERNKGPSSQEVAEQRELEKKAEIRQEREANNREKKEGEQAPGDANKEGGGESGHNRRSLTRPKHLDVFGSGDRKQ